MQPTAGVAKWRPVIQELRIFVSSPGDCAQERAVLDEVVERINSRRLDRSGILLRTFAWEHDVVPRIGPPPQAVVDEQTPLCDIYVGIMSARFGGDGTRESGTEQEFRDALTRFGDSGQPWILFYFNEQPPLPQTIEAVSGLDQGARRFGSELETKGIVGTYAGRSRQRRRGFSRRSSCTCVRCFSDRSSARQSSEEAERPAARTSAQRASGKPVIPPQYLVWLQSKCAGVDLFGLEPKYGSAARLQSIYVPLTTTRPTASRSRQVVRVDMTGRALEASHGPRSCSIGSPTSRCTSLDLPGPGNRRSVAG